MSQNILKEIYEYKKIHVAQRKEMMPLERLQEKIETGGLPRPFAGRIARLVSKKQTALIAEIKKASPSRGTIRQDFDPATLAMAYDEGGATCLSVLTDINYFKGNDDYIEQVRAATSLPVLRKDFMIDPYQIYESRALGADAILLIMRLLTRNSAVFMGDLARQLGMAVICEVHDEKELKTALEVDTKLIGINNRNLNTMEVSIENTLNLSKKIPKDRIVICESGIKTRADIALVKKKAKTHAFLIGESLMSQLDVETATRNLLATG